MSFRVLYSASCGCKHLSGATWHQMTRSPQADCLLYDVHLRWWCHRRGLKRMSQMRSVRVGICRRDRPREKLELNRKSFQNSTSVILIWKLLRDSSATNAEKWHTALLKPIFTWTIRRPLLCWARFGVRPVVSIIIITSGLCCASVSWTGWRRALWFFLYLDAVHNGTAGRTMGPFPK